MVALPKTMTCIIIERPGGPENLVAVERPLPHPAGSEILVAVKSAGVNRPDVSQRKGHYPPPPGAPQDVPGLEIAGEVVAKGPQARRFDIGDRVCGLVAGGGYADYCLVDETNALPVPRGLSWAEAAAIPETFFTVWTNVFQRGRLRAGEWLLAHGGGSGIGTTAIMLAKAFGARVVVTAGSAAKLEACLRLGADAAINYREQDFVEEAKRVTGGRGPDVILDMVAGDYVARNMQCAAMNGRIIQISFLQGYQVNLDMRPLTAKRLTLTGSTLRPRSTAEKAEIARELESQVWPLLESGRCKPVIDSVFPLKDAALAHARMESSQHIGKIVLNI